MDKAEKWSDPRKDPRVKEAETWQTPRKRNCQRKVIRNRKTLIKKN